MRRRRNEGFIIDLFELAARLVGRHRRGSFESMPPRIEPYLGKPACPRCSRPMLERIGEQGSSAGKSFWGCPAFPDCRGTLPAG